MVTFSPKTLAALVLLSPFVIAAPAHKRSLLWPGRLFGDDRWGVVVGPQAAAAPDQAVLGDPAPTANISQPTPALNPAASPSPVTTASADIITPTVLSSSTNKAPTANGFKASKPSTTRKSTTTATSRPTTSRSLQPTSTVRPSSSSKSTTRSSSRASSSPRPTSTSPRPTSTSPRPTSTSPRPTSTPRPSSTFTRPPSTVQPKPSSSSVPATTPKPTTTKVTTSPKPKPTSKTTPKPIPSSTTKTAQPAPTSAPSNGTGTSASDIAAYLKGHNDERAKHGAAPLTFSEALASKAQQWANNCQFKHSGGTLGPFGENLAAGTGSFSIQAGIKAWNDEAPDYDPSNPQASHWTQVVWKSSTQVGCAVQVCSGIFDQPANFYVCEYSPAGNFIGRFPENVQK